VKICGFAEKSLLVALVSAALQASPPLAQAAPQPDSAAVPAASAPLPQSEPRTLADYLTLAALNNPGLKAAFEGWKADLERVPQVRAYPDPRFNFTYLIEEVETRVGPQEMHLGLSQTFPWFGKLGLKGDVAFEASEVSRRRYEASKLRLFQEVKEAYYEYDYLRRAVDVTRRNLQLLADLEQVARIRYRTAAAGYPDVIKAQVELGKIEDRLAAIEDARGPLVARLNGLLDRPPAATLPWPELPPWGLIIHPDDQILSWVSEGNPELMALDHAVRRGEKEVELAGRDSYPDLTLGVNYIVTGEAIDPSLRDSGKDPWMATLSVNLPIWRGKYRAAEREAAARLRSTELAREQRQNELESRIKQVLFECRDAERKISLYRDTLIPMGEQSLEATQTAFMTGESDFLDVVDAQRALLEFELSFDRALASHGQRLAELEMLVGRAIPVAELGP
jgi:outer membrane protein TolC